MLKTRILTAAVLIPLTLAGLFGLSPRVWGSVTLAVMGIAASEWASLAGYSRPARLLFVAATLAIGGTLLWVPGCGFQPDRGWPPSIPLFVCGAATLFWIFVAPVWLGAGWRIESKLVLALTGWLVLIAAWLALVQIQARSPGLLLVLMAVVWIADTAAYFAGRAFGRHKLAPTISPGKTWEGVYGALAATACYALLLLLFAPGGAGERAGSPAAVAGWVGLMLSLAAISMLGDLFESLLKRQRGLKDSGRILPGHGGVLDRIDALLAAMPAAALIVQYALRWLL
jgi:phosphatidate cytidylyltransferase